MHRRTLVWVENVQGSDRTASFPRIPGNKAVSNPFPASRRCSTLWFLFLPQPSKPAMAHTQPSLCLSLALLTPIPTAGKELLLQAFKIDLVILCVWMFFFSACLHGYHMCAWCSWRPEESVGCFGTGAIGGWEPPCGCWELHLDPQGEQTVLSISESSLQPQECSLLKIRMIRLRDFTKKSRKISLSQGPSP